MRLDSTSTSIVTTALAINADGGLTVQMNMVVPNVITLLMLYMCRQMEQIWGEMEDIVLKNLSSFLQFHDKIHSMLNKTMKLGEMGLIELLSQVLMMLFKLCMQMLPDILMQIEIMRLY